MIKIFDLHCDSVQHLSKAIDLSKSTSFHIDIPKLKKANVLGLIWACWVSPGVKNPFHKALELIDKSMDFIENNKRYINLARSYEDLKGDRVNFILGVEGGHIFDQGRWQFKTLYRLGVRVFTLTWNNSNLLAHSAVDNDNLGLTKLGREYIKEMNKSRVIVDLSHSSNASVLEACDLLRIPPIASHSCLRSLNGLVRNISDQALRAIARKGGVCGVNFSRRHLGRYDIIDHIRYIKSIISVNHIAIGSDFDGITDPVVPDISYTKTLAERLHKSGFSRFEVEKILYKNFLRVFRDIC